MESTHPEVYQDFANGLFSLARTKKNFSQQPIDLVLEQTVNADSASQLHGITPLTNSIPARLRWADSHFWRTKLLSNLLEDLNLNKKEDVSEELKPHRIRCNVNAQQSLRLFLSEILNPFEASNDHLYNIFTGKAASESTEKFLTSVLVEVSKQRQTFMEECLERPARFIEPIKRNKLYTFASEGAKRSVKDGERLVAVKMQRDLFGSLLCVSLERKLDMGQVLKYPLTPVPMSLSHLDGSMLKTQKSVLFKCLETSVSCSESLVTGVGATLIDGMFFLHLMVQPPSSFGQIATMVLKAICLYPGSEIHFVCDKYLSPSIKDSERSNREKNVSNSFAIDGAAQKRPTNWKNALRNPFFKEQLIAFLSVHWKNDSYVTVINDKQVFINSGDTCYKFYVYENEVHREEVATLYSRHEEADSRLIFHLFNLSSHLKKVIIRCSDTDILIIALGVFDRIVDDKKVWIDCGKTSDNSRRYVSVNKIYNHFGSNVCKALPALHALTGSDFTSCFSKKGKDKPLKKLVQSKEMQNFLMVLGRTEILEENLFSKIEKVVCFLYGSSKIESLDELRLHTFLLKFKPKRNRPISYTKTLDGAMFPPCSRVMQGKTKRVNFVAARWLSNILPSPPTWSPLNCGWDFEDNQYVIKWFDGDMTPSSVEDIVLAEDSDADDDEEVTFISDEEIDDDSSDYDE